MEHITESARAQTQHAADRSRPQQTVHKDNGLLCPWTNGQCYHREQMGDHCIVRSLTKKKEGGPRQHAALLLIMLSSWKPTCSWCILRAFVMAISGDPNQKQPCAKSESGPPPKSVGRRHQYCTWFRRPNNYSVWISATFSAGGWFGQIIWTPPADLEPESSPNRPWRSKSSPGSQVYPGMYYKNSGLPLRCTTENL